LAALGLIGGGEAGAKRVDLLVERGDLGGGFGRGGGGFGGLGFGECAVGLGECGVGLAGFLELVGDGGELLGGAAALFLALGFELGDLLLEGLELEGGGLGIGQGFGGGGLRGEGGGRALSGHFEVFFQGIDLALAGFELPGEALDFGIGDLEIGLRSGGRRGLYLEVGGSGRDFGRDRGGRGGRGGTGVAHGGGDASG